MNAPYLPGEFGPQPNAAAIVIGTETSHVINVDVQLKQGADAIAGSVVVRGYISSDAAGDTPVTTADTIAIGTDGTIIVADAAHAVFTVKSETSGQFDVNITEASAATYYLNLILPNGEVLHSGAIVFAG